MQLAVVNPPPNRGNRCEANVSLTVSPELCHTVPLRGLVSSADDMVFDAKGTMRMSSQSKLRDAKRIAKIVSTCVNMC